MSRSVDPGDDVGDLELSVPPWASAVVTKLPAILLPRSAMFAVAHHQRAAGADDGAAALDVD
jgi:hypothetical protein